MEKLFIIIPAYNEMETIESVISDWYPIVETIGEESRLVIIDDGSKDDTYSLICEAAKIRSQLIPITKSNSGHGATIQYGYHFAIDQRADYIFQTDSDGQTLPEEFWDFWNIRSDYRMIIGHRNKREDGWKRVFVTKVLKAVIRLCFGANVVDANTPFRLMDSKTLEECLLVIPPDYNLTNVIISVVCVSKGVKVKWLPITFLPRQGGVNSINMKNIFNIGKQAIKDFADINAVMKGLKK